MTPEDERILRETDFQHGPGTVVRDFQTLLDFVGVEGLAVSGTKFFLPITRLKELDERLTHPLRSASKRPQQASFPHIHALYLLFRATGLGVAEGEAGKKGSRIRVDQEQLAKWQSLNPTEKYMSLLEAWWIDAEPSILEDRGRFGDETLLWPALQLLAAAPQSDERPIGLEAIVARSRVYISTYRVADLWKLALFDLFGLLEIQRGEPAPPHYWTIRSARQTRFGQALHNAVVHEAEKRTPESKSVKTVLGGLTDLLMPPESFDDVADAASKDQEPPESLLHPLLGCYFPDWRHTLSPPQQEFRDGAYYFRVSLGKVWRQIVIGADAPLDFLAYAILDAFDFDEDHLYEFQLTSSTGAPLVVAHPAITDEARHTDETSIGELPLQPKQRMIFHYDFGDDWRFDVALENVAEEEEPPKEPKILAMHGRAPKQYEGFDDDDEDEEDDWDDDE